MKILTTHEFTVVCRCPMDRSRDVYRVTVATTETVPVEELLALAESLVELEVFQEDVTREFAKYGSVTTHGTHSGVITTCVAHGGE
jgi:hypothetical protein